MTNSLPCNTTKTIDFYTDYPFSDLELQNTFVNDLENAGYSGVWATENRHDPFLPIAASANRNRRISIGTGVIALLARNPFTVAQMAWDLHYNSGENFILGIGTHSDSHLLTRYGISADQKHERLIEAVQVIREIWSSWFEDRQPNFQGCFYTIRDCPSGYRPITRIQSVPRIYLLCSTIKDLEIAHKVGEGIFTHPTWTSQYLDKYLPSQTAKWQAPFNQYDKKFSVIDGSIIATGAHSAELDISRRHAHDRIADYFLATRYDYVYEALDIMDAVSKFRAEYKAKELVWTTGYVEELYNTFVCEAPLVELGKRLRQRRNKNVTGLFPNIMSYLPRIMPAEIVADIRL